jgi:hypothetical protein
MTLREIRDFKIELLGDVHELASDPVADPEAIREKVEAFFSRLEAETDGKETRTAAR